MGIREYARHRGVSHTAVMKAIADGRIRRRPDRKIDQEEADADWLRNTDQSRPKNSISGDPYLKRGELPAAPAPPLEIDPIEGAPADDGEEIPEYAEARRKREHFQSQIAELDYLERSGELVEKFRVDAGGFSVGRLLRDQLLALPDTLAPVLADMASEADCRRILDEAMRKVCEEVTADLGRILEETPLEVPQ